MLLEKIGTNVARYQLRGDPFSAKTVEGIVAEGIDLAKFDAIPIVKEAGRWVVGGDGHSRLEAIRRLAALKLLPKAWRSGDTWDIPTREVKPSEASRLAKAANLSRSQFTAIEEARIFQRRLDDGESIDAIAESSHKSTVYVSKALALCDLCQDIAQMVEHPGGAEAGGIDRLTAQVLANGFKRYGITRDQQRDLWHQAMKLAGLNFQSAKRFIDTIGKQLGDRRDEPTTGLMFDLPVNVGAILSQAKQRVGGYRKARTGVAMLMSALHDGALDHLPELVQWLRDNGDHQVDELGKKLTEDGEVLAGFVRKPG